MIYPLPVPTGRTLASKRYAAILDEYVGVRTLAAAEQRQLPQALIIACLRFWLSRLLEQHKPQQDAFRAKDPKAYQRKLHHLWQQRLP